MTQALESVGGEDELDDTLDGRVDLVGVEGGVVVHELPDGDVKRLLVILPISFSKIGQQKTCCAGVVYQFPAVGGHMTRHR